MVTKSFVILMIACCALALGTSTAIGTAHASPQMQDVKPFASTVAYDGRLANADGQIVQDGLYSLRFDLFAELSGDQPLWTETVDSVTVESGNFSAILGSQTPIPNDLLDQKLWLAVAVRGPGETIYTDLEPRQDFVIDAPVEAAAINAMTCPHDHYAETWTGSNTSYGFRILNNGNGDGLRLYSKGTASNEGALYAYNSATTGAGNGVYGYSYRGIGVSGVSGSNDAVKGQTSATNKSGVWGRHTGNGYGVFGTSANQFGLGASGKDDSAYDAYGDLFLGGTRGEIMANGIYLNMYTGRNVNFDLDNDNNDPNACLYVWDGQENIRASMCENGTKSAILQTESHGQRAVYTIESPEVWLEDFGTATLVNGEVTVPVDAMFLEMVNLGVDYHVFVTPLGDCQGLFVAAKNGDSFVVKELGGGTSGVSFDYRITAKRFGLEEIRAEIVAASAENELK